jgi:hypothetical protein
MEWIGVIDSAVQAVGRVDTAVGGLAETALMEREVVVEMCEAIVLAKPVLGESADNSGLA